MDLRQLEILQAIAETGSFTACGRKLHVSQSAISRQILLLEEELGEHFTYAQSMGVLAATVMIGVVVVTFLGPENHRVTFRKTA